MKKLIIPAIACALCAGSLIVRSEPKSPPTIPRQAVVFISARESYHYVSVVQNGYTNTYGQPDGMIIEYTSASSGLTNLDYGVALGDGLAYYRGLGLTNFVPQPTYGTYLLTN